jgi:hypothetical protein
VRRDGAFRFQQKLVAPDGEPADWFGEALAEGDDTLIVGAPNHGGPSVGSAYVFTRREGTWTFAQKLVPSGVPTIQRFGEAIAIDGDTVVIGGHGAYASLGQAYVFVRSGGTFVLQQKLVPSVLEGSGIESEFLGFGYAVALDGDTLAVGTYYDADLRAPPAIGLALPTRTRSGKIMRRLLKDVAAGRESTGDTSTLEDLGVLAKLRKDEE